MNDKATPAPDRLDIDALFDMDVVELTILNPKTGNPILAADDKPWTILLAGPNHAETVRLRNMSIGKAMRRQRLRGDAELDPNEVTEETLDGLAARTLGWNTPIMGGKPVEFSKDAARKLYKASQYVRARVQEKLNDDAGFTKASASG